MLFHSLTQSMVFLLQFPNEVQARLAGEDSQSQSLDASGTEHRDGFLVSDGQIGEEYEELMRQARENDERERLKEEEASRKLLQQEEVRL